MLTGKAFLIVAAGFVAAPGHPAMAKDPDAVKAAVACQIDTMSVTLSAKGKGKGKGKGSDQQQYMQYEMHDAMISSSRINPSGGSKGQSGNNPSSVSRSKNR